MRLAIPFVLALAVSMAIVFATAPKVLAQASPREAVVVPALPGEAMRITTPQRAPSSRESLRRYRGVRAYRAAPAGVRVIPARDVQLAFPVYTAQGDRFVRKGGSFFYAGPATDG